MFNWLKSLFGSDNVSDPILSHSLDEIDVAYVIGDVHGCYGPMRDLLSKIEHDIALTPDKRGAIIFLGDLVDRGPQSNEVIEYLRNYAPADAEVHFLKGNHEEVYLKVLSGSISALQSWFGFGGRACVRSYGVDNLGQILMDPNAVSNRIRSKVPQTHIDFISSFKSYITFGKYMCVHAGIRPKLAVEKQNLRDLLWIREEFISYEKAHPYVIIHGHTIVSEPEIHKNRIAVDTGVYNENPLTAVRIDIASDAVTFMQSTAS